MIYLKLLYNFLIVGIFSIGGGYSVLALVRDISKNFSNLNDEMFANFVAIAESTPGPLSVNLATFIGTEEGGVLGAILATLGVVFPAFVIILIFAVFFTKFLKYDKVKRVFAFIRPCVVGVMMAVGLLMFRECMDMSDSKKAVKSILVMICLLIVMPVYKMVVKKKISAIPLIVVGAVLGIAINLIM